MSFSDLTELTATDLLAGYGRGTFSPEEVIRAAIERINVLDPVLCAFRVRTFEQATDEARLRTRQLRRSEIMGPLHGVPVAVKELFDLRHVPTSYGSLVFADHRPDSDAELVRRLRASGAILVGTTRSHEFAWGITSQHETLGGVRNPWNTDHVPGGSSGGSAVAVASGMVPIAIGSDTAGSIRIPAAFCGVIGVKPTFGRLSKRGLMPLARSLDHAGVMARTVRDANLVSAALAGYDADDPDSAFLGEDSESYLLDTQPWTGPLRILCPGELELGVLSDEYRSSFDRAVTTLSRAGSRLRAAKSFSSPEARQIFTTIQFAESYYLHSELLRTYPSHEAEYGPDVRDRLSAASSVSIVDYLAARDKRRILVQSFDSDFHDADVLVSPVSGGPPSTIADPDFCEHRGSRIQFRDLVLPHTIPQNLGRLPGITINIGVDSQRLPIGIQLTAPRGRDRTLMRIAMRIESLLSETALHHCYSVAQPNESSARC